jgi:hypothetical protein
MLQAVAVDVTCSPTATDLPISLTMLTAAKRRRPLKTRSIVPPRRAGPHDPFEAEQGSSLIAKRDGAPSSAPTSLKSGLVWGIF